MAEMLTVKGEFHCQAQEVRTWLKVLFADADEDLDRSEIITTLPFLSPFKPLLDFSLPALAGRDKKLATRHISSWLKKVCPC
jgi:hypothetical protein